MASCKGCNQEIIWGTTPSGSRIPLDRFRNHFYQGRDGKFPFYGGDFQVIPVKVIYRSHLLTCKKADEFSGNNKNQAEDNSAS